VLIFQAGGNTDTWQEMGMMLVRSDDTQVGVTGTGMLLIPWMVQRASSANVAWCV